MSKINAQDSKIKGFSKLSRPEKCWVISHPFKAKTAFVISNKTKQIADSLITTSSLDGDPNGGQVDAFRHSYWMATLSKHIGAKAAIKLGKKHEKGNYIYFKKNKYEDGTIPDFISSKMDLKNNDIGIDIYKNNPNKTDEEIELIIVQEIIDGKMFIIKKNIDGEYLDCNGNVISIEEFKGKWENKKCLVSSDLKY
jgi:hypothetical protein